MVITFIGHRNPKFDNDFRLQLKNKILTLIDEKMPIPFYSAAEVLSTLYALT